MAELSQGVQLYVSTYLRKQDHWFNPGEVSAGAGTTGFSHTIHAIALAGSEFGDATLPF